MSGEAASHPPGTRAVCQRCQTSIEQVRDGHLWCGGCGRYLIHDPERGDWITFAEREYRQRADAHQRQVALSAELAHRAVAALRDRKPPGWQVAAGQHVDAAIHTVDITPPAGPVDAVASLLPPEGTGQGWRVRIHNRTRRVAFPLYQAGGAEAASFDTVGDAADAAVRALHIEIAVTTRR